MLDNNENGVILVKTFAAGVTSGTTLLLCGPNTTYATTIYCAYKNSGVLTGNTITVSTGSVGTAFTIATDVTTATASAPAQTFTVEGFVSATNVQGILVQVKNVTSGSTPVTTYGLSFWNTTSGASNKAAFYTSLVSQTTNPISGSGFTYYSGYALFASYMTTSEPAMNTWIFEAWNQDGSANATLNQVASVGGFASNWFIDNDGGVWFGAYTYDLTTGASFLGIGYIGEVKTQTTITTNTTSTASSSAAKVLVTFSSILFLLIVAFFAF